MTLTEHAHGSALDLNTCRPIQMGRQLFIGPVGPVEAAALRPLLHPRLEGRRPRLGNTTWLARRPLDL